MLYVLTGFICSFIGLVIGCSMASSSKASMCEQCRTYIKLSIKGEI
jgi:hypothetical protein